MATIRPNYGFYGDNSSQLWLLWRQFVPVKKKHTPKNRISFCFSSEIILLWRQFIPVKELIKRYGDSSSQLWLLWRQFVPVIMCLFNILKFIRRYGRLVRSNTVQNMAMDIYFCSVCVMIGVFWQS